MSSTMSWVGASTAETKVDLRHPFCMLLLTSSQAHWECPEFQSCVFFLWLLFVVLFCFSNLKNYSELMILENRGREGGGRGRMRMKKKMIN